MSEHMPGIERQTMRQVECHNICQRRENFHREWQKSMPEDRPDRMQEYATATILRQPLARHLERLQDCLHRGHVEHAPEYIEYTAELGAAAHAGAAVPTPGLGCAWRWLSHYTHWQRRKRLGRM